MSIRSSYLDVDRTLTFARAGSGTRMCWDWDWDWDLRLHGMLRVLAPVMRLIGPGWEHRDWAGPKGLLESRAL